MLVFWIQCISLHLTSVDYCDWTGDVDQLMEECRSLKDERQTLKNDNKQLSVKLEILEQQRARWLATRPVNHTLGLLIGLAWPLKHSAIICLNGHTLWNYLAAMNTFAATRNINDCVFQLIQIHWQGEEPQLPYCCLKTSTMHIQWRFSK